MRTFLVAALLSFVAGRGFAEAAVTIFKTPEGGIQPQAVVDRSGAIHLIYYKGDPSAGDLYYAVRKAGQRDFSKPLAVNNEPGTAIAAGTVRGGQIALGKGGRVHVAWNGSGKAKGKHGSAMLYTRLTEPGRFEPQRNLMTTTALLDGGGAVAADSAGNVYVVWHAARANGKQDEASRQVWIARSKDDGATFAAEAPAWDEPTGACGCCSLRALADDAGRVAILYRAAGEGIHRDLYLLASASAGKELRGAKVHKWEVAACPMSTMALSAGPRGIIAAWETDGQIYFAIIEPGTTRFSAPQALPGSPGNRHHPSVAVNSRGELFIAWAEGTGWKKGGALAWQAFDAERKATAVKGTIANAVPVWGLPTAVAAGEEFVIVH